MRTGSSVKRAAAVGLAVVIGLLGPVPAGPAPARAGETASSTVLGNPTAQPKPVGATATMTATVTPSDASGAVMFYTDDAGTRTELANVALSAGTAVLDLAADMPAGSYEIVAVYSGDATYAGSESALVPLTVGPRPTTLELDLSTSNGSTTLEQWANLILLWQVADAGTIGHIGNFAGTVEVRVDGVVVDNRVTNGNGYFAVNTGLTLGTHTVKATFLPTNTYYATSSAEATFTLTANLVHATASVQYATFYPVIDKYRDTVALRGTRSEPASVSIRVYNSSARVVKSASVGALPGPWSVVWNGRTSSGAILPAGQYKVVQKVTDAHGASKTFTSYVTLSTKRLYKYSATYTKNASQLAKKTSTWVAWSFTLPSATVYSSLVFSIYGKDNYGSGGFGPHDFSRCGSATWSYTCANPYNFFPTVYAWRSVTGVPARNHAGRTTRLYAWGGSGSTRIAYGRVRVVYEILR